MFRWSYCVGKLRTLRSQLAALRMYLETSRAAKSQGLSHIKACRTRQVMGFFPYDIWVEETPEGIFVCVCGGVFVCLFVYLSPLCLAVIQLFLPHSRKDPSKIQLVCPAVSSSTQPGCLITHPLCKAFRQMILSFYSSCCFAEAWRHFPLLRYKYLGTVISPLLSPHQWLQSLLQPAPCKGCIYADCFCLSRCLSGRRSFDLGSAQSVLLRWGAVYKKQGSLIKSYGSLAMDKDSRPESTAKLDYFKKGRHLPLFFLDASCQAVSSWTSAGCRSCFL